MKKWRSNRKSYESPDNTTGTTEEMLLEYFRGIQAGSVRKEMLDELIDTLEEMKDYYCYGKLKFSDEIILAEIRNSITGYTAVLAEESSRPVQDTGTRDVDKFSLIREQLI